MRLTSTSGVARHYFEVVCQPLKAVLSIGDLEHKIRMMVAKCSDKNGRSIARHFPSD